MLYAVGSDLPFAETSVWGGLISLSILLLAFYTDWRITRVYGHAKRPGSVLGWILWIIPVVLIGLTLDGLNEALPRGSSAEITGVPYWLRDSLFQALIILISTPFLVMSTGRAIDANGLEFSKLLDTGRNAMITAAILLFAATFVLIFVDYAFLETQQHSATSSSGITPVSFASSIVASLIWITQAGITAVVYRHIESAVITEGDRL